MLLSAKIEFLRLHPADNVAVAVRTHPESAMVEVDGQPMVLADAIRQGHKVALYTIGVGQPIVKYGQTIGFSTAPIKQGQWVHTHNMEAGAFSRQHAAASAVPPPPPPLVGRTFNGFRRASGRAGTRNYIAVISTVNCSASVARFVAQRFDRQLLRAYPQVDGVVAFSHGGGCGIQIGGLQHQIYNRVAGGIARHPNIAAYLLVGLGCETVSPGHLIQEQKLVQIGGVGDGSIERPLALSMQDLGGTQATVDEAVRLVGSLLPRANDVRREPIAASELVLGTNCGGSDGNSGITANPALGVAADRLVAAGGTVILGETTEIYGAEQLLTRRARTPEVAQKLLDRIAWWEWYSGLFGATPDNNPSPGNKDGGLSTIYEKSLGAVAKAGSTALEEVYQYAEQVRAKGLVVMDTPGLDPVSVTGIVAGGANVVVFTTGRGSCFGCKPTPSIKVATNTPLFERLRDDMDLDAGGILSGRPVEDVGQEIFETILAVASGQRTKSEQHGIGDEEYVPWEVGPTL